MAGSADKFFLPIQQIFSLSFDVCPLTGKGSSWLASQLLVWMTARCSVLPNTYVARAISMIPCTIPPPPPHPFFMNFFGTKKFRCQPYRLALSWVDWPLKYTAQNAHINGAQAWDIRSLGFSWFLQHEVSTCGWLRGENKKKLQIFRGSFRGAKFLTRMLSVFLRRFFF
jgi:hypothetical protein